MVTKTNQTDVLTAACHSALRKTSYTDMFKKLIEAADVITFDMNHETSYAYSKTVHVRQCCDGSGTQSASYGLPGMHVQDLAVGICNLSQLLSLAAGSTMIRDTQENCG